MRLLYIAVTKGWPAALFYDQQGTDEFLDVPADFWEGNLTHTSGGVARNSDNQTLKAVPYGLLQLSINL
jgi:hypothetical protein